MKAWKILAVASVAMAFTAAAQAECGGTHHAMKSASNETATGKVATNRIATNRLATNRLSSNALSANQPGEGAASDIVAIDMPNGDRLSR